MTDIKFFKRRFIVKFMNILNYKYIYIYLYIYTIHVKRNTKQMHEAAFKNVKYI